MTKNDIVSDIADKLDLKQTDVKQVVQMTLDGILDVIVSEGRLELRNFGVFEVRTRKSRKARNPKTGEVIIVPERKVPVFKPGKIMMEKVEADGDTAVTEVTSPPVDSATQPFQQSVKSKAL